VIWLDVLVVFLCVLLFRRYVGDTAWVPSGSMEPAIEPGDLLYINRLAGDIQRCDVVVFKEPTTGARMVKRVVGMPGDTLELVDGTTILNGRPVTRSKYPSTATEKPEMPAAANIVERGLCGYPLRLLESPRLPRNRSNPQTTINAGHYFVLGDSRDNSVDSRDFGEIDATNIVGRVERVLMSIDTSRLMLPRADRTWKSLYSEAGG
jgi:signal peptidase I